VILAAGPIGCDSQRLQDARKPNITPSGYLNGPVQGKRKPNLLLFIHGIFGDTVETWRHENGQGLDKFVLAMPEFKDSFDAFAFGFPSSRIKSGSFSVPEAAKSLHTEFEYEKLFEYERIVIVAHSMGGLVALEALTTYPALRAKVAAVVTYATPYDGAQIALLADKLIKNDALRDMFERSGGNGFLQSLSNRWRQDRTITQSPIKVWCAYEKVETPAGLIVKETSSNALCDGPGEPIAEDHIGIVKPSAATHQSVKVLVNALRDMKLASRPAPELPRVVIIQPSTEFGTLHLQAVRYALEPVAPGAAHIQDCDAPLAELKVGRADVCIEKLKSWLKNEDVVAVVAPAVTEATRAVIKAVDESGLRIPVMVTSAAPRSELFWSGRVVPVYRISSGVDERADELDHLARKFIEAGKNVLLLVEHSINTSTRNYGAQLEGFIRGRDEQFWASKLQSGALARLEYQPGNMAASCEKVRGFATSYPIMFFLGIGGDFRVLVSQCARDISPRPKFLGFMNAYALEEERLSGAKVLDSVFEITDLDLARPGSLSATPESANRFVQRFGNVGPAVRDQAFSYDLGLVLAGALTAIRDARRNNPKLSYKGALEIMDSSIGKTNLIGVTGRLRFGPAPENTHMQNRATDLNLMSVDLRTNRWAPTGPEALLLSFQSIN